MTKLHERTPVRSYEHSYAWAFHVPYYPSPEAMLAIQIAERWALVAAIPDGEDSAGRQKCRLPTRDELAERACGVAAALHKEFHARGWMQQVPPVAEAEAAWKERHQKNGQNDD
jgi:predicted sugar kinase